MAITLLWLTVSLPVVNQARENASLKKHASKVCTQPSSHDEDDQSCNPFGNNTEEKASSNSSNTLTEEYLHDADELFHEAELFLSHHSAPAVAEYVAFHGELLCPPPNPLS